MRGCVCVCFYLSICVCVMFLLLECMCVYFYIYFVLECVILFLCVNLSISKYMFPPYKLKIQKNYKTKKYLFLNKQKIYLFFQKRIIKNLSLRTT